MPANTPGERFTAAISTVIAVAILGAAVAAQQTRTPNSDRLARLESDLRFQLDLAFNTNPEELRERLVALDRTLDAWRHAPQSADDFRLMVVWFRDAIVSSMPGRTSKMPATPTFSVRPSLAVDAAPSEPRHIALKPRPAPAPAPLPARSLEPASPIVVQGGVAAMKPAEPRVPRTTAPPPPRPVEQTLRPAPPSRPAVLASAPTASQTREAYAPQVDVAAAPAVMLNVGELNARIRGYHQGLAEVEATVIADGDLQGAGLAALVAKLEQLAAQYRFVRLYHGALTVAERRVVPAPKSMAETVRLVEQRVKDGGDFLNEFDAQLGDEPTLAERLHALSESVGDQD